VGRTTQVWQTEIHRADGRLACVSRLTTAVVGRPGGAPRPLALVVVALAGGAYAALDAICTHLGCTVGWDAGRGLVICPCHDSRYALDGSVQQGPATRALGTYDVTADALAVTVHVPA
jgi:Rieske Fe-S protein